MNFRRVVTALAVLALFAGLASAQVITPSPISCSVAASTTPSVRSEAIQERVGDVVITCTGGNTPVLGSVSLAQVDKTTITVDFGVAVTSRAETAAGAPAGSNEAALVIDEPGSVTTGILTSGFGPSNTAYIPCPATTSCTTYGQTVGGYWVLSATAVQPPVTAAANVYQGVTSTTSPTKVVFSNVPVLAPVAANVTRVYRITNVRVTPGSASTITATVSISPNSGSANALVLSNNTAPVANAAASLITSIASVGGASLCATTQLTPTGSASKANLAILTFKEGFNTAFKTRLLPLDTKGNNKTGLAQGAAGNDNAAGANQSSEVLYTGTTPMCSLGGSCTVGGTSFTDFGSESGLVLGTFTAGGISSGLADSGTRFKAVFTKLDPNATYWVSTNNIQDYQTLLASTPTVGNGDQTMVPYAQVVGVSSTLNNTSSSNPSEASAEGTFAASGGSANTVVPVIQLVVGTGKNAGNAEVVWEVVNNNPNSSTTFNFALFAVYNSSTPPAVGNVATVTLGYAPTYGSTTTTPVGASQIFIPAMTTPPSTGTNVSTSIFNVLPCQTVLLFPYVTNVSGYETGMAVSNTSMDPFGTVQSTGSCQMNFYGTNQPAAAIPLTSGTGGTTIAAGGQIANTASGLGLINFSGYAIAVCNFQFAHGFAFIQTSKQTLGMGYLPLVMQTGVGANARGQVLVGETLTP